MDYNHKTHVETVCVTVNTKQGHTYNNNYTIRTTGAYRDICTKISEQVRSNWDNHCNQYGEISYSWKFV